MQYSFLPHQDTEKVEGMFATIVIVLPSSYTGGQVHVSHSNSTEMFDLAPHSLTATCALAWYTDVVHEVKPITSGYRLALTYNLIHTSPGIPRPTLPTMHNAIAELRAVLRRWSEGRYPGDREQKVVAYLLAHRYSEINLKMGALKGEDAHKVSHLRPITEELGFIIGLANLSFTKTGVADECGSSGNWDYWGRKRRRRYCYYDEDGMDEDVPEMAEVTDAYMSTTNFVDLDGVEIVKTRSLSLTDDNLIPQDPFDDEDPDDSSYQGYMGNYGGDVQHFYHRTILVLFHKSNEDSMLSSAEKVFYAWRRMLRSNSKDRTPEKVETVRYMLQNGNATAKVALAGVADFGLLWKDSNIWKEAVVKAGADKNIDVFGKEKLLDAIRTFPFEEIRTTLETILKHTANIKAQIDLIDSVRAELSQENVTQWCNDQASLALASLSMAAVSDVPTLMSIVAVKGLSFIAYVLLPKLGKTPSTFAFWVAFITALHEKKPADSQSHDGHEFRDILGQCLNAAIRQWDAAPSPPTYGYNATTTVTVDTNTISRITELVGLCITTGDMAACSRLILVFVRSKEDIAKRFRSLYGPLIPQLRQLLEKHRVELCSPPFGDFVRILIGLYLSAVLGQKPRLAAIKIRKVGCGCPECNALDQFLTSNTVTARYPLRQDRRTHLERQALRAQDLITFHTERSGSPHTLVVTKKPEIVAILQWQTRLKEAKTFLSSIGDESMIAKLMGARYGDVQKALDGTQMFVTKLPDAGGERNEAAGSDQSGASISRTQPSGSTNKRKLNSNRVVSTTTTPDPASAAETTRHVQNVPVNPLRSTLTSPISVTQTSLPSNQSSTSAQATPGNTIKTHIGGPSQPAPQPRRSAAYLNRKAQTVTGPVIDLTDSD